MAAGVEAGGRSECLGLIQQLPDLVNAEVKWNFPLRQLISETMTWVPKKRLVEWLNSPKSSFGELHEEYPFKMNDALDAHCKKIQEVAQRVAAISWDHGASFFSEVDTKFKKAAKNIHIDPPGSLLDPKAYLMQFVRNIQRATGILLKNVDMDNQCFNALCQIFDMPENQTLMDIDLDKKVCHLMQLLEKEPKIAKDKLAKHIQSNWALPPEREKQVADHLAEFFVRHNPFNLTSEEKIVSAVISGNQKALIGKSLNYRCYPSPFSLQIGKVEISDRESKGIATLWSRDGISQATLVIDSEKQKIAQLIIYRVNQTGLEAFIRANKYSRVSFEMEYKINSTIGIPNPFQTNMKYELSVSSGSSASRKSRYISYNFKPQGGRDVSLVKFRVYKDNHSSITMIIGAKEFEVEIGWETYASLFNVLAPRKEVFDFQKMSLDSDVRLLELARKPLATAGLSKKALLEKDKLKAELLSNLIEGYRNQVDHFMAAFAHINASQASLDEATFQLICGKNILFERLCNNQFVKGQYGVDVGALMTPALKRRLATALIHEAQVCLLANVDPEAQQGNQDLISQLCVATRLAKEMEGSIAIPFIGSTGSGKSTAVSYFMGIPMETFTDEYKEERVRQKEGVAGEVPKIGFSLGLSETVHANQFSFAPPPPFRPKSRHEIPPDHMPTFANGLTEHNLKMVDFPGFRDTRGTHLEIVTNFSIDRAMAAFKSVAALMIVVPYENITAERTGLLLATLEELETKFPSLLKEGVVRDRVHFVVTNYKGIDRQALLNRFYKLVDECTDQSLPGKKYFEYLSTQMMRGQVHLLDPTSPNQRLDILNKIIKDYKREEFDSIQSDYQGGFRDPKMQLRVGDVLHGAIICWKNLLDGYLKNIDRLKTIETEEKAKCIAIQAAKKEVDEKAAVLECLVDFEKQNTTIDPVREDVLEVFQEILRDAEVAKAKLTHDSDTLQKEIANFEREMTSNTRKIGEIQAEIKKLSTGSIQESLYECSYKPGQKIEFSGHWSAGVDLDAKFRRAVDNGLDDVSIRDGEIVDNPSTVVVGKDGWWLNRYVVLEREYELVPDDLSEGDKLKKLKELADGVGHRSVILQNGSGWRIDIDSAGDIKFLNIKTHESGRKLVYSYKETGKVEPPYPKLIIKAVLPKQVYNRRSIEEKQADCEKLKNENLRFGEQIAIKQGALEETTAQLKKLEDELKKDLSSQLEKAISGAKTQLEVSSRTMELLNSQLEDLEKEAAQVNESKKMHAISICFYRDIIDGTYDCCKVFQPVEKDKLGGAIQAKSSEVFKKCREFIDQYGKSMKKIDEDIEKIFPFGLPTDDDLRGEASPAGVFGLPSMQSGPDAAGENQAVPTKGKSLWSGGRLLRWIKGKTSGAAGDDKFKAVNSGDVASTSTGVVDGPLPIYVSPLPVRQREPGRPEESQSFNLSHANMSYMLNIEPHSDDSGVDEDGDQKAIERAMGARELDAFLEELDSLGSGRNSARTHKEPDDFLEDQSRDDTLVSRHGVGRDSLRSEQFSGFSSNASEPAEDQEEDVRVGVAHASPRQFERHGGKNDSVRSEQFSGFSDTVSEQDGEQQTGVIVRSNAQGRPKWNANKVRMDNWAAELSEPEPRNAQSQREASTQSRGTAVEGEAFYNPSLSAWSESSTGMQMQQDKRSYKKSSVGQYWHPTQLNSKVDPTRRTSASQSIHVSAHQVNIISGSPVEIASASPASYETKGREVQMRPNSVYGFDEDDETQDGAGGELPTQQTMNAGRADADYYSLPRDARLPRGNPMQAVQRDPKSVLVEVQGRRPMQFTDRVGPTTNVHSPQSKGRHHMETPELRQSGDDGEYASAHDSIPPFRAAKPQGIASAFPETELNPEYDAGGDEPQDGVDGKGQIPAKKPEYAGEGDVVPYNDSPESKAWRQKYGVNQDVFAGSEASYPHDSLEQVSYEAGSVWSSADGSHAEDDQAAGFQRQYTNNGYLDQHSVGDEEEPGGWAGLYAEVTSVGDAANPYFASNELNDGREGVAVHIPNGQVIVHDPDYDEAKE